MQFFFACKNMPFFAYKTLVSVKNGQNRRFNLWNRAVSGCVGKVPEWILVIFKHQDHFGIVLASFWARFGVVFTPFWGLFGSFFFTPFWPFWPCVHLVSGPFLTRPPCLCIVFFFFWGPLDYLRNFPCRIDVTKTQYFFWRLRLVSAHFSSFCGCSWVFWVLGHFETFSAKKNKLAQVASVSF